MGYYDTFAEILPKVKELALRMEESLRKEEPTLEIYNPFKYGIGCYQEFLKKFFANSWPRFVIIGLNPGFKGAVQTCIPFTDVYHCMRELKIDPRDYINTTGNVNPANYINKFEATSKIFYEAITEYWNTDEFFSRNLVLNAFPLGMGYQSSVNNKENSSIKNVGPKDLKAPLRNKINRLVEEYLKLILNTVPQCRIVTLGEYAEERVKKLGRNQHNISHPSPVALNTQKISREEWKKEFISIFKPDVSRLYPTVRRIPPELGEGLILGTGSDYEFHKELMESPCELASPRLQWLATKIYCFHNNVEEWEFMSQEYQVQLKYIRFAKEILERFQILFKDDIDSLKRIGII